MSVYRDTWVAVVWHSGGSRRLGHTSMLTSSQGSWSGMPRVGGSVQRDPSMGKGPSLVEATALFEAMEAAS